MKVRNNNYGINCLSLDIFGSETSFKSLRVMKLNL